MNVFRLFISFLLIETSAKIGQPVAFHSAAADLLQSESVASTASPPTSVLVAYLPSITLLTLPPAEFPEQVIIESPAAPISGPSLPPTESPEQLIHEFPAAPISEGPPLPPAESPEQVIIESPAAPISAPSLPPAESPEQLIHEFPAEWSTSGQPVAFHSAAADLLQSESVASTASPPTSVLVAYL